MEDQTKLSQPTDSLVLSYLDLRKALGIIGILLPFTVAFGKILLDSPGILSSISSYYYSIMGDVFVGSLCAIGVFLWSYRGYELRDVIAGHIAAVSAVGLALFPTAPDTGATSGQMLISGFHAGFAAAYFLTLSYFALVLFRKTNPNGEMTQMKKIRNIIYLLCGIIMLTCMLGIVASHYIPDPSIQAVHPTFWLESLAILAFGLSWFVKGEAILKDE